VPGVEHLAPTLTSADGSKGKSALLAAMQVRRLTPVECERLQGFPDKYTLVPFRGRPAADGNRYKTLGNSMAVPVMGWLGERMQLVESLMK
jgi:DNA (cytosine-5)-methyltransferase 1